MRWRFADAKMKDFNPLPEVAAEWLARLTRDENYEWREGANVDAGACPECQAELGSRTRSKLGVICGKCQAKLTWDRLECGEPEKERCDWRGSGDGILILGPIGVGKTHLAAAMVNALREKEVPAHFSSCPDLAWEARVAIGRRDTDDPYHVTACYQGVLVLDDLGAVKYVTAAGEPTHAHDGIAHVLRHRYDYLLPTIITAHQSLSKLAEHVGIGIASRMQQMTKVELAGDDYRATLRAS